MAKKTAQCYTFAVPPHASGDITSVCDGEGAGGAKRTLSGVVALERCVHHRTNPRGDRFARPGHRSFPRHGRPWHEIWKPRLARYVGGDAVAAGNSFRRLSWSLRPTCGGELDGDRTGGFVSAATIGACHGLCFASTER